MSGGSETKPLTLTQHLSSPSPNSELCAPHLTCFEPESHGELIDGLEFHKFYFDNGEVERRKNSDKLLSIRPHPQSLHYLWRPSTRLCSILEFK